MPEDDNVLVVDRLCKDYDVHDSSHTGSRVFDNLSFSQNSGSFIAIVGASGCGKTTLLRIVAGLLAPSAGRVYVQDREVTAPPPGTVLVFQDYRNSLLPWRNVRRNVRLGVEQSGSGNMEKDRRVERFLTMVGLDDEAGRYPWELSGGMQQRVAVARALASAPKLLLLDEPFGSLDVITRSKLEDEMLGLWSTIGMTILLVTHDIAEAIYLADRILVLAGSPARIAADIAVELPRPRDQIATRSMSEFTAIRNNIFRTLLEGAP